MKSEAVTCAGSKKYRERKDQGVKRPRSEITGSKMPRSELFAPRHFAHDYFAPRNLICRVEAYGRNELQPQTNYYTFVLHTSKLKFSALFNVEKSQFVACGEKMYMPKCANPRVLPRNAQYLHINQ